MMGGTHILIGAGVGAALAVTGHAELLPAILLSSGGALLPDIDHPGAAIHTIIPGPTRAASLLVGHRGFTHSLIALGLLLFFIEPYPIMYPVGAGYISHLLADSLTKRGIPLLWPAKAKFKMPLTFTTGSFIESIVALAAALSLMYLVNLAM